MGVTALMTAALAAVVSERRAAEEPLRHLAVTDALTGLANYRQLMHVLRCDGWPHGSRRRSPPTARCPR